MTLLCWKHTRARKSSFSFFSLGSEAHVHAQLMSEFHNVQSSVNQFRRHVSTGHSRSVCDMGSPRKTFCPATRLRTQALTKTWDATHQTTGMCGVTDWLNWTFAWGSEFRLVLKGLNRLILTAVVVRLRAVIIHLYFSTKCTKHFCCLEIQLSGGQHDTTHLFVSDLNFSAIDKPTTVEH